LSDATASPQLVDDASPSDLDDPRPKAAQLRIEGVGVLPERDKHILDNFLGHGAIHVACRQMGEKRTIARVQEVQRVAAAVGEPLHQLLVSKRL